MKKSGLNVDSDIKYVKDESIDFLYSLNVFEHIENDSAAMSEVYRVLKPGGKALIYVPANQKLFSAMDAKVGHYRRYSKKQLGGLAQERLGSKTKLEYVDSIGYFAALAYKYVGSKTGNLSVRSIKFYDRFIFPLSRQIDKVTNSFLGKNLVLEIQKNE